MNEYYEKTEQVYWFYENNKDIEKTLDKLKDTIKYPKHYTNCSMKTIIKY
jgi:uncharacterized protein YlbG (UPF0298 family)